MTMPIRPSAVPYGELARAMTLRRVRREELPELAAIDAHSPGGGWSEESFAGELALAWSRTEVAILTDEARSHLVGFMVYWEVADEVQLLNIAVRPNCRRAGVGRALLARLIERARSRNAGRVLLEVRRSNEVAQKLYVQAGFIVSGVRSGYYERGAEDAILMECPLPVR